MLHTLKNGRVNNYASFPVAAGIFFSLYGCTQTFKPTQLMIENLTSQPDVAKKSGKSRRGFASMDKERHKLVSSKGGKAIRAAYSTRTLAPAPETTSSPVN